jgi:hypothetical protein
MNRKERKEEFSLIEARGHGEEPQEGEARRKPFSRRGAGAQRKQANQQVFAKNSK